MHTWIQIDKKSIENNLNEFRKLLGKQVLLMPVIKANAYGHGFLEVAKICDNNKNVDCICVVSDDEALILVSEKIKTPIQILSFFELDFNKIKLLIKYNVIFSVYTIEQAKFLSKAGSKMNMIINIHLKLDIGTSRVGILQEEINNFAISILKLSNLKINGVFGHFASSEDNVVYTKRQYKLFLDVVKQLEDIGIIFKIKHIACSAASISLPSTLMNAARVGLSIYGLYPTTKFKKYIKLKPVLSMNTKIIQIKILQAGSKIGYGSSYKTNKKIKLAVLPIGYADGLDRKLSNVGSVLINGEKCSIRGRICMNLSMIELPLNSNARAGDIVVIIGSQGNKSITIDNIASLTNTINYEVVSRLNPMIQRIYK